MASSADAQFGAMAPCWRLLERAKDYMEEVRRVLLTSRCDGVPVSFFRHLFLRRKGVLSNFFVVLIDVRSDPFHRSDVATSGCVMSLTFLPSFLAVCTLSAAAPEFWIIRRIN